MRKLRRTRFFEDTSMGDWTSQRFAPAATRRCHHMRRTRLFNACAILSKMMVKYYLILCYKSLILLHSNVLYENLSRNTSEGKER